MKPFFLIALTLALGFAASAQPPLGSPLSPSRGLLPRSLVTQLPCEPHPGSGRLLISFPTPYGRFYIDRDRYLHLIELPLRAPAAPVAVDPLPVGATTNGIPGAFQTLLHQGETVFYSQGNFFAYHGNDAFIVIKPPVGAHLNALPPEARPVGDSIAIPGATLLPVNRYGALAYEIRRR